MRSYVLPIENGSTSPLLHICSTCPTCCPHLPSLSGIQLVRTGKFPVSRCAPPAVLHHRCVKNTQSLGLFILPYPSGVARCASPGGQSQSPLPLTLPPPAIAA